MNKNVLIKNNKLLFKKWFYNIKQSEIEDYKIAIEDRVHYILETIAKENNLKLEYWYVDGAAEGEVGNIDVDSEFLSLVIKYRPEPKTILYKYKKEKIELKWGFPTKWIWNDFEDELVAGLQRK